MAAPAVTHLNGHPSGHPAGHPTDHPAGRPAGHPTAHPTGPTTRRKFGQLIESASEPGRARYALIAQTLRNQVLRGDWPPGSAMPAEQALADAHGVALGTVRQALQLLVTEGLIERIHGRGTFVRAGLAGASMLRFFRFGQGHGHGPGLDAVVPQSVILRRRRIAAPAWLVARLGGAEGDPVLALLRLRSVGGMPCLLEQIWLPLPDFEALASGPTDAWGDLLYPLYAQRCSRPVHRAVDEIGFAALAAGHAALLGLAAGSPAAVVTRQAFNLAGRCIEHRVTRGDALAFHYTVTIT